MKSLDCYISKYFFIAEKIAEARNPNHIVVLQFFQTKPFAVLGGIKEVLKLLRQNIPKKNLIVKYLREGTHITAKEVVLEIEGRYHEFGRFEGIIDGILSRQTSLATNAYLCVKAANKKEVICMSDRSDHYSNQKRDGKAFFIGGIRAFSSEAQSPSKHCTVYGSIPHAIIQNMNGNLIECMKYYQIFYPDEELVALVDYNNDVIGDSLKVLRHFKDKLYGVRVDTSSIISDEMFKDNPKYGVNPEQIFNLRKALDKEGGDHVKIYVSSGFTPEKIAHFEALNTPVDGYGVGEYLLKINNTFCADATLLNGKKVAKKGREYILNKKLKIFNWK